MHGTDLRPPKKRTVSLIARAVLLILQVALPFILYQTLKWDNPVPAALVASVVVLSMLYLVWLG
jgi:hypothetical protein